ncbi:hypothetical protein QC762_0114590 [Podospora pseudocomata]|uniref:Uncharacterized protein n=1 Tax=Podospora pseudocomata TaxID=2093779 RepID=A0ABR0G585_9PEZI|nr:hypothetical protein QC762_0114590 [Podospora pseudocomata]
MNLSSDLINFGIHRSSSSKVPFFEPGRRWERGVKASLVTAYFWWIMTNSGEKDTSQANTYSDARRSTGTRSSPPSRPGFSRSPGRLDLFGDPAMASMLKLPWNLRSFDILTVPDFPVARFKLEDRCRILETRNHVNLAIAGA